MKSRFDFCVGNMKSCVDFCVDGVKKIALIFELIT